MSLLKRYARYAEAFETTYDDDNWSRLAEYFTDDAVYEAAAPLAAHVVGRDAVLEHFRNTVNAFDRRFGNRRLLPTRPPAEHDDTVVMEWEATYEVEGAPELRLAGVETARFRGGRICRLEDAFAPGLEESLAAWMSEHARLLKEP